LTENLIAKWTVIILLIALSGWLFWEQRAQKEGDPGPIKIGIDLSGGTSIIYTINRASLDKLPPEDRAKALDESIDTISRRIDSLGVKELTVRKVGDDKILIEAPKMTEAELASIQDQMLALGNLEFLIGIDEFTASSPLEVAGEKPDEYVRYVFDKAKADAQRKTAYETGKDLLGQSYRDSEPYELIDDSRQPMKRLPIVWMVQRVEEGEAKEEIHKAQNPKPGQTVRHELIKGSWLYRDPHFFGGTKDGFTGLHIRDVRRDADKIGQRTVVFNIDKFKQEEFAEYTGKYLNKPMALALNDELWSAPTIEQELRESVQIRNPRGFTAQEQTFLVNCLTSGSLRLKPRWESQEKIPPALGELAVKRGAIASAISGVLILLFMIWYYRFAGLVADFALVLNLFFILTTMVLFEATLSLPAIAGIILSVGMGVDANILVFERTREELQKGKPLLQALQGGYQGAFSAIFDGNVTSAITAALMIHFGTGPIRGFGTTLLAGLIIQMFTALFVTKAVFGLWIKKGWMTKMSFIDVFKVGHYPWISKARAWQLASLGLMLMTVVLWLSTGDSKYGLDFTGGTSARIKLAQPATTAEVQDIIDNIRGVDGNQKYKERDVILRTGVAGAEGNRSPEFDVKLRSEASIGDAEVKDFMQDHLSHMFPNAASVVGLQSTRPGEWKVEFAFKSPVPAKTTIRTIDEYQDENRSKPFKASLIEAIDPSTPDPEDPTAEVKASRFTIEVARQDVAAGSSVNDLRAAFAGKLASADPFANVSYMGPNVVASLKESAVVSMIFALGAIILYVWFRFKEVKYGVAGVIALIHDVIVPCGLGILLHKLGILNVPITLQSIAAFLTIIGYSINDTIVIFDRVRENLGHIKGTYREIMDISISQTFGRTILTTSAVFTVLLVLFVCNVGQDSPLEGMAFLLLMGTICGCYSTIFIACPFAVWVTERREKQLKNRGKPPAPPAVAAAL
jgi:SecD/SecF fusion protein